MASLVLDINIILSNSGKGNGELLEYVINTELKLKVYKGDLIKNNL